MIKLYGWKYGSGVIAEKITYMVERKGKLYKWKEALKRDDKGLIALNSEA